jgi:hypothetical protein
MPRLAELESAAAGAADISVNSDNAARLVVTILISNLPGCELGFRSIA